MTTLAVYDRSGKKVGSVDVDPAEIAPRINKQLLHEAVIMYQANLRQGTFRSKSRGDVAGTTKKMYRQKGTGNARAGSRRSGIRRGGGHIFAKRPRDFSYHLPRKACQLATRMAVASKIADEQIVVIDELAFKEPKTKDMAAILKALDCTGSLLVTTAAHDPNVYKSARNIAGVSVSPVSDLNALNVLTPDRMLVTKSALEAIRERASVANAPAPKEKKRREKVERKPARAKAAKPKRAPRAAKAKAAKPAKRAPRKAKSE